jgi:hypothetical protein
MWEKVNSSQGGTADLLQRGRDVERSRRRLHRCTVVSLSTVILHALGLHTH